MIGLQMLTGKVAFYAIAALAALLLGCNIAWYARAGVLHAQVRAAEAKESAALTEREAWKSKAAELATANHSGQDVITKLRAELEFAQGEARRIDAQGRAAVADAQSRAAGAERDLRAFRARYAQQVAAPDCAGALAAVQQHCPQFEGY